MKLQSVEMRLASKLRTSLTTRNRSWTAGKVAATLLKGYQAATTTATGAAAAAGRDSSSDPEQQRGGACR
jgi:hypothetical protein